MKSLLWLAVGGASAAALFFVTRRTRAPEVPTPSTRTYGEGTRVALALPAGWRRVTGSEVGALPELQAQANALRSTQGFTTMQYGTLVPFLAADGNTYATWVEQHYHEPGGASKPWGYHHGVTLLTKIQPASTLSGTRSC